jgi:hypothetical protein
MTHDQLARVFPDGRTVHVPSDGNPLKGYELARADIERRGDGDVSSSSGGQIGGFLTALFKGKSSTSSDEDDEGVVPAAANKPASGVVLASARSVDTKSADPVPMPRAKPQFAAAIQLAAADAQIIPAARTTAAAPAPAEKSEPKPETPADIINARGFWGDDLPAAKQATAAQIAALKAREAVGAPDPQATASVSENFNKALAYAPANAPVERSNIITASAPLPRSVRPTRNAGAAATEINTVVAKGTQGQGSVIATSTRISAAKGNDLWMRVVMLAPSASSAMLTTVLGDTDMTLMRAHFVKPQAAITMTFSNDPMMGMNCDSFTGSVTATLPTTSFVVRTAALR